MQFFKEAVADSTVVTFEYSERHVNALFLKHCRGVVTLLARAVAGAQRHGGSDDKRIDAALQSLVGFAALAVGEGMALLSLVSAGLERQAWVHLRSLNEYLARIELFLGDPEKAYQFKIAAAAEADRFASMLPGRVPADLLEAAKRRFLADVDNDEVRKEKDVNRRYAVVDGAPAARLLMHRILHS